ncbi:unnamed protein product [Amoebophrya sp. A120]|nr:unnamed protein product [Amoebophrya sp. A120]|eukprot:GSA120T00002608001.1
MNSWAFFIPPGHFIRLFQLVEGSDMSASVLLTPIPPGHGFHVQIINDRIIPVKGRRGG